MAFEVFEHTADLGLSVHAETLEELFTEGACGLFSLLVVNLEDVRPVQQKDLIIPSPPADDSDGSDTNVLWFFDWLSELLFVFETEHLLLSRFDVAFADGELRASCQGEPVDWNRHEMDHEVKAVTYHGLQLAKVGATWHAQVIVDI